MAMNMKRRQFASSSFSQIKAQHLPSTTPPPSAIANGTCGLSSPSKDGNNGNRNFEQLEPYQISTPINRQNTNNLLTPLAPQTPQTSLVTPQNPVRMGISLPITVANSNNSNPNMTNTNPMTPSQEQGQGIPVKCIMGRSTVYQPLPNLKGNFIITCTGFARAMRNHIWGEHVFMFEKIPETNEDDWSKWAACADTHATADEWLEVILPGFELNGVAWFVVRGIDPETGALQFYFCPRNDPRGNPILGEFGSMPRFDASQVSIVDGRA